MDKYIFAEGLQIRGLSAVPFICLVVLVVFVVGFVFCVGKEENGESSGWQTAKEVVLGCEMCILRC